MNIRTSPSRLAKALRLLVGALQSARLVAYLSLSRTPRLVIGDSHSLFLHDRLPGIRVQPGKDGWWIIHLGPRLMYSLATKGLPRWVYMLLAPLRFRKRRSFIVLVVGEIDVRVHLAEHASESFLFVDNFLELAQSLRQRYNASPVILAPVPPSDIGKDNVELPRVGTLAQRVAAQARLISVLEGRARKTRIALAETPDLASADGSLRPEFTSDGCHVNALGSHLQRSAIEMAAE